MDLKVIKLSEVSHTKVCIWYRLHVELKKNDTN